MLGIDIRALWWENSTLTPRYVLMLVGQLPGNSAFHASIRGGPKYRPWTLEAQLMGSMVNMLYVANMQRARKKPRKMPVNPPKPSIKAKRNTGNIRRIAGLRSTRPVAGS